MIVGPIGTYFLTLNTIFRGLSVVDFLSITCFTEHHIGNSTFAGATAALMANIVLVAYVVVAMKEDESEKRVAEDKARKGE